MTSLEFWTEARLLMYPILLVFGLMWSVFFFVQHRHGTVMTGFWATLLGLAVAALGLAGFMSLTLAQVLGGYSSITSGVLTLGLATIVLVLVAGVLAQGRLMWSGRGRK